MKQARLRPQAETDLVTAARHYAKEGGADLAERMFDAALKALEPIERMPAIGSPRLGQLCDIPRLRAWRMDGFPMQWLYFEASDHLDVVRLLGDRQDIAVILEAGARWVRLAQSLQYRRGVGTATAVWRLTVQAGDKGSHSAWRNS